MVCERNSGFHAYFTADDAHGLLIDITKFFELMKRFEDDNQLLNLYGHFQ
jgi:hypothetical protein